VQHFQPLGHQLGVQNSRAAEVPSRAVQARDQTKPDCITSHVKSPILVPDAFTAITAGIPPVTITDT